MLSTSRTSQNLLLVVFTITITLAIWLGNKWYFNDWFDSSFKIAAKVTSLSATVLLCWCVLLDNMKRG